MSDDELMRITKSLLDEDREYIAKAASPDRSWRSTERIMDYQNTDRGAYRMIDDFPRPQERAQRSWLRADRARQGILPRPSAGRRVRSLNRKFPIESTSPERRLAAFRREGLGVPHSGTRGLLDSQRAGIDLKGKLAPDLRMPKTPASRILRWLSRLK